ncbi:MAG: hypothetical protein WCJ30_12880, partial [Deltaproteobacteria bacterium]
MRIRVTDDDRANALVGGVPAPRPRPAVEPFDRDAMIERFVRLGERDKHLYQLHFERYNPTIATSPEEARAFIALLGFNGPFGSFLDAVRSGETPRGTGNHPRQNPAYAVAQFCVLGVEGLYAVVSEQHCPHTVRRAIETEIVPFLTESERAEFRGQIHGLAAVEGYTPRLVTMLGYLGEPADSLRARIAQWPAGSGKPAQIGLNYGWGGNDTVVALFALGDPDEIAREAARLEASPATSGEARMLLAATGTRCLDRLVASAMLATARVDAEVIAKALSLVEAPECARPMLELMIGSKAPGVAREWLDEHPEFGAEGLVSLVGTHGARGDAATTYLGTLHKRGLDDVLEAAFATLDETHANLARARLLDTPDDRLETVTDAELPGWASVCFGDPARVQVPDAVLSPEDANPTPEVQLGASDRARLGAPELPAPETNTTAAPFDLEDCLAKLLATHAQHSSWHFWKLNTIELSMPMTREEAHFWVSAFGATGQKDAPDVEKRLRAMRFDGVIGRSPIVNDMLVAPAYVLNGAEGLAESTTGDHSATQWVERAVRAVVRFVSPADRDALRTHLLTRASTSTATLLLARRLGAIREQLSDAIAKMPSLTHAHRNPVLELLYVLDDPQTIVREATRIGAVPWDGKTARQWVAATGRDGAQILANAIGKTYGEKAPMLKALAQIRAPEIARFMLTFRKSPSMKETARHWLEANAVFAIDALLPLVGTKDKLADSAVDHLRELRRRGYGTIIAARSGGSPAVQKTVLDPRAGLSRPSSADEAMAPVLPPIAIETANGPRQLSHAHVATVLAELRVCTLGAPTPRIAVLRANAERHSLDRFAWALFQEWLQDGAPTKERWRLEAVGQLGSDTSALKLAALIRQWPGESQHQRAVLGLDCLRAIGTDTALMQI